MVSVMEMGRNSNLKVCSCSTWSGMRDYVQVGKSAVSEAVDVLRCSKLENMSKDDQMFYMK